MDNADKKAKFALAILHKTLPHFDSGGTVNALDAPTAPANQLGGPAQLQSGSTAGNSIVGGNNGLVSQLMGSNNFQAQGANLQAGTNAAQLNQAYNGAQTGLTNQQNFVGALQGQNGVANQSANYNQLGQIASGQGPNPAQTMLNQATGQNVANQAALMAGQRGSGANAGMIARQAAQQGANTQQQAAGQAATNQANQSLAAINAQTGIAQNQVNQLGQANTGYNTAAQNEQNILQQANSAYNSANVNMTNGMNTVNAGTAAGNAANKSGIFGSVTGAIGSLFADGGEVEADLGKSDYNSTATSQPPTIDPGAPTAPSSNGKSGGGAGLIGGLMSLLANGGSIPSPTGPQSAFARHMMMCGGGEALKMAEGGKVPAMVSAGEVYLKPDQMKQVVNGADPMKIGEKIKGKEVVKGAKNDYANDIIPKTLEAGGGILPKTVTKSKNPSEAGRRFVMAIAAKHGMHVTHKKPSK